MEFFTGLGLFIIIFIFCIAMYLCFKVCFEMIFGTDSIIAVMVSICVISFVIMLIFMVPEEFGLQKITTSSNIIIENN